jgi:hypothetical protein
VPAPDESLPSNAWKPMPPNRQMAENTSVLRRVTNGCEAWRCGR